ncbi:hypothetical protein [Halobacillus karajensis]|uniref:hypothetical protein n=1 Tax=Halobacillus karajensis TaxID=195088 RepID=UPI00045CA4B7|nr:hypothetical protein [Halobacillus karajensis]CDQ21704.1 hypothetical protein BN982_04113 [Halobacillus karajensis]
MASNARVDIKTDRFKSYTAKSKKVYTNALNVCLNDLKRTASESAPHKKGTLEKSHNSSIEYEGANPVGKVTFSVRESSSSGNYNYALKMHEGDYELGEGSKRKPGGTGMSGKTYDVGAGYLENPLKGEQETYQKFIQKELKSFSRKF